MYCIATGAMFSSGFFLLPGLAVMYAGPSAVLAYLLAGLLIVPSMLCMAELATALPRAGGAYYFMDRSLGPAVGAVTGIGTWLALITKSAFALVGMGAYLAVAPGLGQFFSPGTLGTTWLIKVIACGLTILFVAINIFGAKESTRLQSLLVLAILGVMAFFAAEGLWHVAGRLPAGALKDRYTPFLHSREGLGGLVGTIGLVFISYVGLPQIASISEEVRRPERNLPLGMILSLGTATLVYVVGTFIMVAVLGPDRLAGDLTPVATTADELSEWLPNSLGLILV
ncbi:MAG: APC family permease, partial [Phycisphaerae bacterium]